MTTTPLFPIALSSQLDDTGVERVHAANTKMIALPEYVLSVAVPTILMNGFGESEFFMIEKGTISSPFAAPESPDFCAQVQRLSTGRLLARRSSKTFYKDDIAAWVDTGNALDDNPALLESGGVLITSPSGGGAIKRSVDFGVTWSTVLLSGAGPLVDFCACGSTLIALCSNTSNRVYTSVDAGLTWAQATLTGLSWNGPTGSGYSRFAAAVGNTAVLAGRNVSLSRPAVLVTDDAGVTWDVVELPVVTGYTQITGVSTDGTDILVVLAKPGGPANGIIYKYNIGSKTFTVVLAATNYFPSNLWNAKGVWYCSVYALNNKASWWWSNDGIVWTFAEYGTTYNEVLSVAYDARGTGE